MAHKGTFRPQNPEKYRGNPSLIIYRSSWERNFMEWCDTNEAVIWWNSEENRIPYYDPVSKKRRMYYPDFLLARRCYDGIIREDLVEVKPSRQVKGPPVNPRKKTRGWLNEVYMYTTNMAKWQAASEWCEDRGYNFRLLIEKDVKQWKML